MQNYRYYNMESCHAAAAAAAGRKRVLDDSQLVVTDGYRKRFKPDVDVEQNDNYANKWNLLPSIVYEVLSMFKSDKLRNSADGDENEEKQNKIFGTLSCQETPLNIIAENSKVNLEYVISDKKISLDDNKILNTSNCQKIPLNIITENPKVNHEYITNDTKISLDDIEPNENKKREVSKELKLYDILNLSLSNVKIPTTKPPACICKYCSYVDNLPITQSAVINVLALNNSFDLQRNQNHKMLNSDMYSANIEVSGCSSNDCHCVNKSHPESLKNVWTNELMDLMRKNETVYKDHKSKNNVNTSNSVLCITKVYKAKEHVQNLHQLCNKCKRSKYSRNYACICNVPYHTRKTNYHHSRSFDKNFFHRNTRRRY